jgi:predicted ester cyclase
VLRFSVHGTHDGELMGASPSGNAVDVDAMSILRFEDGKVAERWTQLDTLSLMAQLGLVPQPAAA